MSTQRLLVSLPISKHDWLRIFPQKEEKNKAIYPLDYCTLHLKHCETSLACVPNILLVRGRGRVRVESCRYVALIKRLLITPDTTRRHVAWDHSHEVCLRFNDHFHVQVEARMIIATCKQTSLSPPGQAVVLYILILIHIQACLLFIDIDNNILFEFSYTTTL